MAGPEAGEIFYANGGPVGFSGWGAGEPNGGGNENVLHMLSGQFWNDVGATYPNNRGYVVEFSASPGDFDIDGAVDGNDFLIWQRGESTNGLVTVDLEAWKSQFGASTVADSRPVPEPAALVIAMIAITSMGTRSRIIATQRAAI